MIWLRQYPSLKLLAWIFGVDASTICRTIQDVTKELWNSLGPKLQFPSLVERIEHGKRLGKYFIVLVIDGSEQQILESVVKKKGNITFSGKKKFHTFTKLIGVAPNGRIWFISKSFPGKRLSSQVNILGKVSDINLSEMPENFIFNLLTEDEWIMADRGFGGLIHLKILSYHNFKGTDLDKPFLSICSVEENAIAMIKKWKICDLQLRKNLGDMEVTLEFHHQIWVICAILCNLYYEPLR
jgi:hypothetical protein